LGELYDTHEQYWLEILWNGWDVRFGDDISLLMSPGDKKDKVRASSYARYEKLNVEQSLRLGSMLRDTSEPLEDLVNPPTWNVSVTWMDDELVLQAYRDDYSQEHRMNVRAARFAAAEFYLMELLTEPLPQVNGQTLDQVMDAWELLAGLARSLKSMFMSRLENLPSDQPLSIDDLAYFSPQIPARQLVYLIHDCLNFSLASAESIINLFTFDEGCSRDKSIWTSPLVSVGDGKLVPVILPLISPLMLRIVQDWAKLGGMTLEKKGTEYEKSLESGLSRSIESSDTIEDAQVYENIKTVEFNGEQEEIDILFRLGNKIFVCEAKAPIVPQEPLQIHNHFERLSKACRQADRKSGFVRKNLDQLHEQYDFSYPINELEIHPLVLTSMPIGVGWSDLNVPVIDRYILFRYFDTGGRIQSTAYSEQGFDTKKAETYYESEEEAVGRIIEYLNEPPTLYNLFQGLEYDIKAIPNVEDRKVVKAQLKVDWEKVVK
jgi:hypothetical protein